MAKGNYRFIINTGWSPKHEFSVIFSTAKGFYGRDFTQNVCGGYLRYSSPLV